MPDVPALLLAAGTARRMGRPKQLLPWGGVTLIEHQLATLRRAGLEVTVILGAYAERIDPILAPHDVPSYPFSDWQRGMGASIAFGMEQLMQSEKEIAGVLVCLVDQPLVKAAHFTALLDRFRPGTKQIIASRDTEGNTGPPVLFDAHYFPELLKLDGELGAKPVVKRHRERVEWVDCATSLADVDTPEAYARLKNFQSANGQ